MVCNLKDNEDKLQYNFEDTEDKLQDASVEAMQIVEAIAEIPDLSRAILLIKEEHERKTVLYLPFIRRVLRSEYSCWIPHAHDSIRSSEAIY